MFRKPAKPPLPPDAENHVGRLTSLIAALIASGEDHVESAEEQLEQAITELIDERIKLAMTGKMQAPPRAKSEK